jgi:polysaccharide biosynthesis protein PslG
MILLLACAAPGDAPELAAPPAPDLGLGVAVEDAARGICVSVQLDRWDAEHRATQVAALHDVGVRTIRHDLRWAYVMRARDTYDWTLEDAWFSGAEGFDVIAMIAYGTTWASGGLDEFYPPTDPADFASFVAAARARYAIDRWEIWNEPNAGYRFWKVGDPPSLAGDPVAYAALFAAAATALSADDEVMIGGTFFHEQGIPGGVSFVSDAIAADARVGTLADSVGFHPYTLYPPRVGPEEDDDGEIPLWEMQATQEEAAGGLPAVITEFGWPSTEVTEEEQADYILREFALAQAGGIRDVCVYTLEDGEFADNPEDAFGLFRRGGTERKPSGDAVAALAEAIDGLDCNGRAEAALGLPEGVYAVRWSSGTRTATLLWTTGATKTVTFALTSGERWSGEVGGTPVWVREGVEG